MIESLYMTLAERERLKELADRLGLSDRRIKGRVHRRDGALDREEQEEVARYLMSKQAESEEESTTGS